MPRLGHWALVAGLGLSSAVAMAAPVSTFTVGLNSGPGAPTTINPGQSTVLRITLSNSDTTQDFTGVHFVNPLTPTTVNGNTLEVTGPATITGGALCEQGTVSVSPPSGAINLSGMTVPRQVGATAGQCFIDVPIRGVSANGASSSPAYVLGSDSVQMTGGDGNLTGGQQQFTINSVSRPTWSKSFSNDTAVLNGSAVNLTLRVTNSSGDVPLTGVQFTDVFPTAGGQPVIVATGGAPTFSGCANTPSVTAANGAGQVGVSGLNVNPGQTCSITVPVRANQTNGVYELSRANTMLPSSFSSDQGLTPSGNASADITVRSPLRMTKTAPTYVASGVPGAFTITLFNDSGSPLPVTQFNEPNISDVQSGLQLTPTSATNSCGPNPAVAGNGFTSGGYSIPANGSCVITVNFTGTTAASNAPLTFTNTIPLGAVQTSTAGVVSQPVSAPVTIVDQLRVSKSQSPATVAPGNPVQYTVRVYNYSSSPLSNVHVLDNLLNGSTYLTGMHGGIDRSPTLSAACGVPSTPATTGASGQIDFTIPTLPARAGSTPGQCDLTFWAITGRTVTTGTNNQIAQCGVYYGTPGNSATCNGRASNTVTAEHVTALTAAKTFNGTSYSTTGGANNRIAPEGTVVTMRIRVRNNTDQPVTGMTLNDPLPLSNGSPLRIADPANASSTCGASFTAAPGSTSVAFNGGTVPARSGSTAGECVFQVDVVGAAGTYPNRADVAGTQTFGDGTTEPISVQSTQATLTYTGALSATKSFSPAAMTTDGKTEVLIRLRNNDTTATLTNVSVTDPLPAAPNGLRLADPAGLRTTCAGSIAMTGAPGSKSPTLTGATLPPGGSCDFIFSVVNDGTGSGNWVNTIPAGSITANGGIVNQTPVSATLTRQSAVTPTISKSVSPTSVAPGQPARLTINIGNGSTAVTGLGVTDYFTVDGTPGGAPNGMRIAADPKASSNCPGGAVAAVAGTSRVTLSGATLAASATCVVEVDVESIQPGAIVNTIPLNSLVTDQGHTNTTTTGAATLQTSANMTVSKQFTPSTMKAGERSRLRITFINPTILAAANFKVTDPLPAGLTVPAGPNVQQTCGALTNVNVSDPTRVAISGGVLAAAVGGVPSSCYVELDVTANADGVYTNTIPGSSLEVGCRADGTGCTTVPHPPATGIVRVLKPLVVNKAIANLTLDTNPPAGSGMTTGVASSAAGTAATLTIRLQNPNTIDVTQATFVDTLPQGMAVADPTNASTTCPGGVPSAAPSGTSVRLTGATVPAGASCTLTVNVLSNTPGRYTNTIPSGGVTTLEGVTNEEPTRAELLVSTPPTVGKQFTPSVIPPNGTSRLTIALGNSNGTAITLTQALVDNLPTAPGAMVVANPPAIGGTCTGAVTANAGAATVTYASGATIPAGGCTIEVNVTAAVPGAYNNNIPAGGLRTNVGSNADPANAPLTVSTKGYVSGKVFRDNNVTPNGTFEQATDAPIPGSPIELRTGATCSGPLAAQTVTDAMGNYTFANLDAGTYSVCQPGQPAGTINGATTAGTINAINGSTGTPGSGSNPTDATSQIAGIVLNANGAGEVSGSVNNNFAEVVLSSITGRVFLDQNNDGVANGTDSGIPGVPVELLNGSGTVIRTVQTGPDGSYRFDNLPPGTYSVRQPQQPPNTSNGTTTAGSVPNGGTPGTATPVTTPVSQITNIVLPPNTVASGNNFAEIVNGRSISGAIFLDHNNNGTRDGNDTGIANQTVTLEGTDVNGNTVTRTTTTGPDGSYSFTGLPEGTYTVKQPTQPGGTTNGAPRAGTTGGTPSNPTGTSSQITGINLTGSNTVSANNHFPELPGNGVDVALRKTHTVNSFGQGSSRGFFILTPSNEGTDATEGPVRVVDTLPTGMTVAAPLPSGRGWVCTAQVGGSTVDCSSNDVIAGGGAQGQPITVYVTVAAGTAGQALTNRAVISNDKEPAGFNGNNEAMDTVTVSESSRLSGTVWRDTNHDRKLDPNEERVADWVVEVLQGGVVVATTRTGPDGTYQVTDLAPGSNYEVRFRDPVSGLAYGESVTNEHADGSNPGGAQTGYGRLTGLTLQAGDNIVEQSLPLDPGGVVYDSVTRLPIQGATVTLSGPPGFDPSIHVSHGRGSVVTGPNGYYEFWLNPGAPAGVYTLSVSAPSHLPGASSLIPACTNAPLNVSGVYKPEVIQAGAGAPGLNVPAHDPAACVAGSGPNTTQYYYSFVLTPGVSGHVVNNHLPLDPVLAGAIVVSKTSPKVNVTKGELVPYTITATNTLQNVLGNVDVQDYIPPGFRYRVGSATYNGMPAEPVVSGRQLTWKGQNFAPAEKKTYQLLLMVGAGVGEGEYVNQAWALNGLVQERMSNVANATVRVVPDPTFDCSDLIGKVFDDKNANGYQDQGERGIPNVRVVTARGLLVTTDAEGRFHVACAAIPQADRGSNFVMKLDERTLPSGYRLTTENPRDVRVTRGKMVKLNFGATVHKVLRLEVDARAFEKDGDALSAQWNGKLEQLLAQLAERPTVLRIAYRQTGEGQDVAARRLKALTQRIHDGYAGQAKQRKDKEDDTPPLVIETESFEQNKAEGAAK